MNSAKYAAINKQIGGSIDKCLYDPDINEDLYMAIVKNEEPYLSRTDESMYSLESIYETLICNKSVTISENSKEQLEAMREIANFVTLCR